MSSQQSGTGADDGVVAEPFDQTNGVVDGLEGESGGTADGEVRSGADRRDDDGEIDDTDDVAGQGAMDAGYIVGHQESHPGPFRARRASDDARARPKPPAYVRKR